MKLIQIHALATQSVLACLAKIPFLHPRLRRTPVKKDYCPDIVVEVFGKDRKKHTLVVMVRANGQPRIIRDVAALLAICKDKYVNPYGIIVASYISEQSSAICKNAGIGYIDLKGNCYIFFDSVYIERTGIPNDSERRNLRYIYSPKAERVLRVLLREVSKFWKVKELAQSAGVSLGHTSNVKTRLEQGEFLDIGGNGIRVKRPRELLVEWSKNYSVRRSEIHRFWSPLKLAELETELFAYAQKEALQCALTGFSAGTIYAPMVIQPRLFAYCSGDIGKLAETLQLKRVESGENVQLISPYDEGVFIDSCKLHGKMLVSPVQAYLDLIVMGGRGEEAAKSIMEQVLKW
ncbi:MAG: type IV toxin-antitoxin system AbiEi family antitoxin [Elusimicrobiota bacterium]|nr:type IV toxin-antitoxin system AbiEi family antitoxin [Elusimicrobiota bacterium]